jgi:phosphoglycolate phosphatase
MSSAAAHRNVLFDLDGTLVDSRPGIVAGLRHAMRQLGHELSADGPLDWAIGPPLWDVMARLLEPFGDAEVDRAVALYREWYGSVGLFDALPYPGVPEVLDGLVASGRALFVCTSKRTPYAHRVLEHLALAGRFRSVYGAEPHGRFDRKAELVRHILEAEYLVRAETVLVGDREHDVAAARANGLRVVAVTYGYGSREELAAAGADLFCDDLARLPGLL